MERLGKIIEARITTDDLIIGSSSKSTGFLTEISGPSLPHDGNGKLSTTPSSVSLLYGNYAMVGSVTALEFQVSCCISEQ